MAVLPLRHLGDSVLRKKAKPVKEIDEEILKLVEDMIDTMYANQGVGLAAPQVGVSKQVIVFDNVEAAYGTDPQVLLNPTLIASEGSMKEEEGCLSIPEIKDFVERSLKVTVTGMDIQGRQVKIEAEGLPARVLQHEIDHVEGVLFVDRLGALKRNLAISRWKKVRKEMEAKESA